MVGFLRQQCYGVYVQVSSGGFGSFTALLCKKWLLPSQREMCRGVTWRYGLACVSYYSVCRIKEERRH